VKKCLKTSLQLITISNHKDCNGQVGVVGFCFEADCQYDGGKIKLSYKAVFHYGGQPPPKKPRK
jgi:hypothetical protein